MTWMRRLALPLAAALTVLAASALAFSPAALGADTRPRFVIGVLGDSYASGEGSPDVHGHHSALGDLVAAECIQLPGTPPPCFTEKWWSPDSWFPGRDAVFPQQDDAGWQDAARSCHRSTKATGPQAAMKIADRFPDVRVEVLDFACGGSTIGRSCGLIPGVNPLSLTCLPGSTEAGGGLLLPWLGPEHALVGAPTIPPQLTALRDYARNTGREVDAIVMDIGGNDGEFAELVTECLNIVNPVDDCSNNPTVARIREKLIPDASVPDDPDPNEPMSERYRRVAAAITAQFPDARPDEVYLTALPNATHDAPPTTTGPANPQDFCDGTQTADDLFNNATLNESVAIEGVLEGLNGTMQRAAERHGWVFLPQIFDAWRDHGICADGASFVRTNNDALRIQGDEGIPLPHISAGIAHPNEAGFANTATIVADILEEQVRMRFRAPTLTLNGVQANTAFTVSWADPSPRSLPETRWELELASPAVVQRLASDSSAGVGFAPGSGNSFGWRVLRQGEFQVRVRGCRTVQQNTYCGPFSNAITVATGVPGSPLDLRSAALSAADRAGSGNPIRLAWTKGPNTPASARYEVHYGQFGGSNCGTTISSCTLLAGGGVANTTSTSTKINLPQPGEWSFRVRACSTAGCSAFSGFLTANVTANPPPKTPVGTFVVRAPRKARAGKRTRVDIAWRTPKRWTTLDRIDVRLRARRKRLGTIRFTQDDGVFWVINGKRRRFGHPDTEGRLTAGAFALELGRSSLVRFGKRSRRVVLRLSIVPKRQLRRKNLTLAISARNDRGRRQGERLASVIRVR